LGLIDAFLMDSIKKTNFLLFCKQFINTSLLIHKGIYNLVTHYIYSFSFYLPKKFIISYLSLKYWMFITIKTEVIHWAKLLWSRLHQRQEDTRTAYGKGRWWKEFEL